MAADTASYTGFNVQIYLHSASPPSKAEILD
jgi:hypothetical protein